MAAGGDQNWTEAAPDAVAPPPHHPRFPLFDGMRAIAVFAVLVLHVASSGRSATRPPASSSFT